MTSGRYRVTINGFTVQGETWDDPFQWDGKRDEVFLTAKVVTLDSTGKTLSSSEPVSKVMGDTNNQNGRIRAGSASDRGGLRTGDSFPTSTPWIQSTAPTNARNYPPMKLWEGDLHQGKDVCLIAPSIWEDDTSGPILNDWTNWANQLATKVGPDAAKLAAANPAAAAIVAATTLGLGIAVSAMEGGVVGSSGDRPIGMASSGANKYIFDPQVLRLTYDVAEHLIRTEPAGRGKGVLALRYQDDVRLQGDYIMYLQVERVGNAAMPTPAPKPPSAPTPTPTPLPAPPVALMNDARIIDLQVPSVVRNGSKFTVSVVLRNTGTRPWSASGPHPHQLGSQNPQDNTLWRRSRIDLPHDVQPGQQVTVEATLIAPLTVIPDQTFAFQWRMVQEGRGWFGDPTPNRSIRVTNSYDSYDVSEEFPTPIGVFRTRPTVIGED